MTSDNQIHELLPSFVTGKLSADEQAAFAEHLETCEACREERALLEQLREGARAAGESFFEDHPSVDRLVSAVRGELDAESKATVRRHIALCSACSAEASWVRGEAIAGTLDAQPHASGPKRSNLAGGALGWIAAAAAVILLGVIWLDRPDSKASRTGLVHAEFLEPTERGGAATDAIRLRAEDKAVQLVILIDLPLSSFPLTLEILNEAGITIHRAEGIEPESLLDDLYLIFSCDRADCPPGRYSAIIAGSDEAIAGLRQNFEIVD